MCSNVCGVSFFIESFVADLDRRKYLLEVYFYVVFFDSGSFLRKMTV